MIIIVRAINVVIEAVALILQKVVKAVILVLPAVTAKVVSVGGNIEVEGVEGIGIGIEIEAIVDIDVAIIARGLAVIVEEVQARVEVYHRKVTIPAVHLAREEVEALLVLARGQSMEEDILENTKRTVENMNQTTKVRGKAFSTSPIPTYFPFFF